MDKTIKDISMESKRTEKLVSAIYLLTSFFDNAEPMKWRLRDLGGKLISHNENRNIVLEVMSLFSVAKNAGLVSDANFEIMYRELSHSAPTQSLGELMSNMSEDSTVLKTQDKPLDKPLYIASSISTTPSAIKDKSAQKPAHKEAGSVAIKKNNRQSAILATLKKKKEIMIKDVSPLIPSVSEKTIQRELLAMVQAGILRKIGEKRWSRYTLAE